MELSWKEHSIDGKINVVALARPKSDDLWALGRSRRPFGASTLVLHRQPSGWHRAYKVNGCLDSIGTLGDGSVLAVGESLSALFHGGQWSKISSGLKGSERIWGAHPGCANALGAEGLFYFDRRSWTLVDLEAQGVRGGWADGDGDSAGKGWVVGTYGTHSCMASGSGATWQQDECDSWYLYRVFVGDEGPAFAAGGDGLWRHDGTMWVDVDGYGSSLSHLPLALSTAGSTAIVVSCNLRELRLGGRTTSDLEVFIATGWQDIGSPISVAAMIKSDVRPVIAIDTGTRLLVARGSSIWESSPLMSL